MYFWSTLTGSIVIFTDIGSIYNFGRILSQPLPLEGLPILSLINSRPSKFPLPRWLENYYVRTSLQCIYYLSPIRSPMVAVFPTDTCHHILYGKRNTGYYFSSCPFTMPYSFWLLNPLKSSANSSTELLSPGSPRKLIREKFSAPSYQTKYTS